MAYQIDGWSVVAQYRRCGKISCKVCADGRGHGPYYYGTKKIDGKLRSKYFGRELPIQYIQENTQDELIRLRAQVDELHAELARITAERNELRQRVSSVETNQANVSSGTTDELRELTRAEVEAIWNDATATLSDSDILVLKNTQDSLMRGLFAENSDKTHLATGKGARPYVCPFRSTRRGGRMRFGSPEKLIATAIPWLVQRQEAAMERRRSVEANKALQRESKRQQLRTLPMAELVQLKDKLARDLASGSMHGWTMSRSEADEMLSLMSEVLEERRMRDG